MEIIFVSIELGTHSIKVVIANVRKDYTVNVLGCGRVDSMGGVEKGKIFRADIVEEQLAIAVESALKQAGMATLRGCFVSVLLAGNIIQQSIETSEITVSTPNHVIGEEEVARVVNYVWQKNISGRMRPIYTTERYFELDGKRIVADPRGQSSATLAASVFRICAESAMLETVENCIQQASDMEKVIVYCSAPQALMMVNMNLPLEERSNGAFLSIDLGAGTTSYVFVMGGKCLSMQQFTLGFDHAANDVNIAYSIGIDTARRLLQRFQNAGISVAEGNTPRMPYLELRRDFPSGKARALPSASVQTIVRLRYHEIFSLIQAQILKDVGADEPRIDRVVLSGGAAALCGVVELAREVFGCPAEIAQMTGVTGPAEMMNQAAFVVSMGILRASRSVMEDYRERQEGTESEAEQTAETPAGVWMRRMKKAVLSALNLD